VIESTLSSDPRFSDISALRGVRSSIVYPLVAGDHLVGLLSINRVRNPRPYRRADLERASVLASQVLLALENRRLLQSVAVSERLAAIGQVAAGVAHEINNPITCVLANQRFLEDGLKELAGAVGDAATEDQVAAAELLGELLDALADAQSGAGHVRDIVRDMQALARGNDTPTEVDVNDVVRSALRVASANLRERAQVTTDLGRDTEVLANEGRLTQVFVNLLVNAGQAIGKGSEACGTITVTSRRESDRVVIDLADTGPGIPPQDLARLFEPFFTTKGPDAGTGLGLPISRDIVRRLGGELRAASVLGQGATFTVDLPAARPAPDSGVERPGAAHPTVAMPGPSRVDRPRVLFVDDDPAILRAFRRAFQHDHEIVSAANGAQALSVLEQSTAFDAIVCDLIMPELSGMELYRRIRETDPAVARAFVFITGAIERRVVKEFLTGVENRAIEKPLDFGELRRAIESTVGRSSQGPV
jgi:signal transduction histidine kinase/ActR/RegA family two-component response regulator